MGVGTQVATITPQLKGSYEVHLGRRGNLMMTEWKDKLKSEDTKAYSGVVAANEPYELNFTMTTEAAVQGQLVNEFVGAGQGRGDRHHGRYTTAVVQHSRIRED